jgi:hypothetical protein
MVVIDLLKQEWLKTRRSKAFYKNLTVNILIGAGAVYFCSMLLILGFQISAVLEQFHAVAGLSPTELLNGTIVYAMIAGIIIRLFMQSLGTVNLFSYQLLPIRRSIIVNFLLLKSVFSPFNYFTLFFIVPFAATTVNSYYGGTVAMRFVVNSVFLIWFNSLFTAFLKRRFASNIKSFIVIFFIVAAAVSLEYFKLFSLYRISLSTFGFLLHNPMGSIMIFVLPASAFVLNRWFFARNYYPEYFNRKAARSSLETKGINLSFFDRFGAIGDFMTMELKLVLRHKRTRALLYMSIFFLFYGLMFYTNDRYGNSDGFVFFIAMFMTGLLMFMYGQWIISWDSAYFDGLMTKNIPVRHYIQANYNLLVIANVICFILTTPYFFFGIKIIQMHIAAFLFNTGINTILLLYFATYNTKRIDLSQNSAFSQQGTTFKNFLIVVPMMFIPMGIITLLSLFVETLTILSVLSGIGITGIVFHRSMIRLCVRQFNKRKYALAEGFRASE